MKVAIYNASWSTLGGGEKYSCAIADVLGGEGHLVTIVDGGRGIKLERLREYFHLVLPNVNVVSDRDVRHVLGKADLGVIISNFRPYGLPSVKTIYVLQIPYPPITLSGVAARVIRGEVREAAKDVLRKRLLADARRSSGVLVYSSFVQSNLARYHGVHAEVLYPPIDDFSGTAPKEKAILSVGRIFHGLYNDKRYDVMIDAFRELYCTLGVGAGEYWIAGSCGGDDDAQRYLSSLRERASGLPVRFHVNTPYAELRSLYGRASLFWHAAGFGIDEEREPHRTEHFGMSTVEAMSASCVPVVVDNGGQREIVRDGTSGFVWRTTAELVERTASLLQHPAAYEHLRANARKRFTDFDRQHFSGRLLSIISTIDRSS